MANDEQDTLHIAEIPYDTGELRFRYSRRMSSAGDRWVREGAFTAYHRNGNLASEGTYLDGKEHGPWNDYHENGRLAAQGGYAAGEETGTWRYWDALGEEQLED